MKPELMMLAGICLLLFAAMGYYALLRIPAELALVYSVLTLIALMHIGGVSVGARTGALAFCVLAFLGLVWFVLRGRERKAFFSLGIAAFLILAAGAVFVFRGDFIQYFDDFHQWGVAVKYILKTDRIPQGADFVGSAHIPAETSLFVAFFQILGGYNEGNMYAASFMLTAAAVVLPLMNLNWKQLGKAVLYLGFFYIGLYSVYYHPYKSLYVDLPAAVWAGAACLLWTMLGERREITIIRKCAMVLPLVIFVPRIKWGVGVLLWVFVLGYLVVDSFARLPADELKKQIGRVWKKGIIVLAACVVVVGAAWHFLGTKFIPARMSGLVEALTFSSQKARLTAKMLFDNIFHKALTSYPSMRLCTAQMAIAIVLLILLIAAWQGSASIRRVMRAAAVYYPLCVVAYIVGLYVSYVSVFSYEESVKNATGYRYLSIVIVFGFMLLAGYLLIAMAHTNHLKSAATALCAGLCVLALSNINTKIIYKASAYHFWELPQYKVIKETKEQIAAIEEVIGEDDRVYMLSNAYSLDNMNEYPLCVALYYMENQVSNYLRMPWKYQEDGSLVFVHKADAVIEDFPAVLKEGGYTYLWVHSYDDYLRGQLKEKFDCPGVQNGLYRIEYGADGDIKLTLKQPL